MNEDETTELIPIWERQPYETKTGFDRFFFHFLTQKPPRTIVAAYRSYIESKQGKTAASKVKKASGQWLSWAYARDKNGDPIPGAFTWQKRGEAWDAYKRELIRAAELDEAVKIQKKGREILDEALTKIQKMVQGMPIKDIPPHQVASFLRAVYGEITTFFDLEPPIRVSDAPDDAAANERPFDLQAWQTRRVNQMKQIAAMRAAEDEDDPEGE